MQARTSLDLAYSNPATDECIWVDLLQETKLPAWPKQKTPQQLEMLTLHSHFRLLPANCHLDVLMT